MTKKLYEWRWMLISLLAILPMSLWGNTKKEPVSISFTSKKQVGGILNCRLNDINFDEVKDIQLEGSGLTIHWADGSTEAFRTGDITLKSQTFTIRGTLSSGYVGFDSMKEVQSTTLSGRLEVHGSANNINLRGCTKLTDFSCSSSQLTSLDVSGCPNLKGLLCSNDQLTTLDVTQCPNLTELVCDGNQLTTLDITPCPNLTMLVCFSNQLSSLDLSKCSNLNKLTCFGNQLPSLDLSKCPNLTELDCSSNQLTTLDITPCPNLTKLFCSENQLATLDITPCPNLMLLYCQENQLTTLNVTHGSNLSLLYCSRNKLATLDVTRCPNLTELTCYDNQLATLDVTHCSKLNYLSCYGNQLATLDVTHCSNLTNLSCSENQLASLDVTHCSNLNYLYCDGNQLGIKAMDRLLEGVSKLKQLIKFVCLPGNILIKKQYEKYKNDIPFNFYSKEEQKDIPLSEDKFYHISFGTQPVRIEGLEKEADVDVAEGSILYLVALPGYEIESVNGVAYNPKEGYQVNSEADAKLDIKVVRKSAAAVGDVNQIDINVYPNPVANEMQIRVPNDFVGKTAYLYNMSGKIVRAIRLTEVETRAEVSQLPAGQYLLRLAHHVQKIIKK